MNLKDFFANKEETPELYWSLVLESGWVQAGIWYIGETSAEVISIGPGAAWETEEELIGAVDAALSSAIQKLPEDSKEPSKTVFGVPSAWVKDGEISEEYLEKIKGLCGDLSLTPVGFVVLPEAVAHLYKSEEGTPLSAIILGLGKESLEISVFKLGNLSGVTQVARSVSIAEDVTEGLSRFEGANPLPSRFIIYDGKGAELEEAKNTLNKETWEGNEKISFLHTPKIETLDSERKVLATSLAGANEIGQVSHIATKELSNQPDALPEDTEELQNVTSVENDLAAEDLGFALGKDVTQNVNPVHEVEPPRPVPAPMHAAPEVKLEPKVNGYFERTKSMLHGFSQKFFGSKPTPIHAPSKKSYTTAAIVAAIALVILGLSWWFLPKAKITIYVSPKTFQEEVSMKFNTDGKTDISSGIIPAKLLTSEASGEKTKAASGTKLIGDKAKGSVQVQNGTAFPINLSAGTLLVSSGNLKFSLDNSASVSAALSPSSPGTTNVNVTADAIGAEFNLAKDEIFKVGNYPKAEVDAKASANFSGGSSQQISAISQADQDSLETQLKDELGQKVKTEIESEVLPEQIFINDLAEISITSEDFDHKVGEQADSLKLTLKVSATAVAANKEKLLEYARGVLKDKIPSGFVLRDSQIAFKFTFDSVEDNDYLYKADLSANFLPQVDTSGIIKKISGKTPSVTEDYLSTIPGFSRAQVTLSPRLPGFLGTLPHIGKNITIEIVAER